MKAIVCDKCGKVVLLDDEKRLMFPRCVYRLIGDCYDQELDLCEDCKNELLEAVRNTKEGLGP